MLIICIFWFISFFIIDSNTKNVFNFNLYNESSNKKITKNSLIHELETNFNNFDNNLYLDIDISSSLTYENDYYNYDKIPTEHLKLNPYNKSNVIFNIRNLKNIYLLNTNNFTINDAYNILSNNDTVIDIKASSYKIELKNQFYDSGNKSISQNNLASNLELELLNPISIDMAYCKIFKVDLYSIFLNIIKTQIHYNYKYFNPNNNSYPSAILYFKTYLDEKIKMTLNKPKPIYFAYDFNFEKLLTLKTTNFYNNLNDISINPASITLDFDWEKLFIIRRLSKEYINNINNSNNFYYYFLWNKLIPLYFINNKITVSLSNELVNNTIILWENNMFINNELIVRTDSNKQTNILSNFKESNNGFSLNAETLFNNIFNSNNAIIYENKKIIFHFVCRLSFLKIEEFLEMNTTLLFNSNKYASELVDEYKNIYDKKSILDFLNSQIRIREGILFTEILTFDDVNFDKFIDFENDIKKWDIRILNNNYYLPTYNENGNIFFLAKIRNWKFYNDLDHDIFQGDYSKSFKDKLIEHSNFIYLNQKYHFSNDGYFIIKILTNKRTSIMDENDSNIFWKLNSIDNLSKIKEHFLHESNYKTTLTNNSEFVFTNQIQSTSINKELNIDMQLHNPITINYFNSNKNNFGNPINNIIAMIYNLPINNAISDKNKIILRNNNKYYLNHKYKLDIKPLTTNEFEINISNKNNNKFDFSISTGEMLNLLYDTLNENEISLIDAITCEYTTTQKIINWYFILFIILILMGITLLLFIAYKKLKINGKKHKK